MLDTEKEEIEKIFPKSVGCILECGGNLIRNESQFDELCECIHDGSLNWALVAYSPRIEYVCDKCGKKFDRSRFNDFGVVRGVNV